ncbi:MAG: hypothetical protein ACLQFR_17740 [Streptosporangiaceae bacterium]
MLIGTIGLYAYRDQEMTVVDLRRLLHRAARGGELAGGLVRTGNADSGTTRLPRHRTRRRTKPAFGAAETVDLDAADDQKTQ